MHSKIMRQISAWLPVVLWCVLIFRFSSGSIPSASMIYWQDFAVKKTGHVLLFGALAFLIYRALKINKIKSDKAAFTAVILSTIYGATDEFHQLYTKGRESRIRDVFIDGSGALLVVLLLYYLPPKLNIELRKLLQKLDIV